MKRIVSTWLLSQLLTAIGLKCKTCHDLSSFGKGANSYSGHLFASSLQHLNNFLAW